MHPVLQFATTNRSQIIRAFQIWYGILVLYLVWTTWALLADHPSSITRYQIGLGMGQAAILMFGVVTLPGILGRFGMRHWLITIGILFRRYTGVSSFALALGHALSLYFLPLLTAGQIPTFPPPAFLAFGSLALFLFTLLAATSNDWSVRRLGRYWKILHRAVYLIFWFIFLHVALQEVGLWSMLIGTLGILEVISLVYDWIKRRNVSSTIVSSPSA